MERIVYIVLIIGAGVLGAISHETDMYRTCQKEGETRSSAWVTEGFTCNKEHSNG